MEGKQVMITGGTSGIGFALARGLAGMGASVLIVSRDEEKCRRVADEIKNQTGNPNLSYLQADLSSQAEVRRLAAQTNQQLDRLDVLVNNAGAIFWKREESADGIEKTFALNHLGYFLLTNLLLDKLRQTPDARIVITGSGSHRCQALELENLELRDNYFLYRAYGRSKLANLYFTYELARRLKGEAITVNAFNPGWVQTHIGQSTRFGKALMRVGNIFATPLEKGSQTGIYLASSPEVRGISGKYYFKGEAVQTSQISYDEDIARQLWQISAEMTGLA